MYRFVKNKEIINPESFDSLANLILNNTSLFINGIRYRIIEIEFYYRNVNNHNDQYTHCCDEQKLWGKFYFHRYKNGTYKNGTYKGLDMTLGKMNTHFGILIRSIYNTIENYVVTGSCNVVNDIIKKYDCESIIDFTNNKTLDMLSNDRNFLVKNRKWKNREQIYYGKRVGLSDKYPEFRYKKYRYLIMKDHIKKQKRDLEKLI